MDEGISGIIKANERMLLNAMKHKKERAMMNQDEWDKTHNNSNDDTGGIVDRIDFSREVEDALRLLVGEDFSIFAYLLKQVADLQARVKKLEDKDSFNAPYYF